MPLEPLARQARDRVELTGLLEKMCRAWHDLGTVLATQSSGSALIQPDHHVIQAADYEQRRRTYEWQSVRGEIGASAS
jgi:hypothetical protein